MYIKHQLKNGLTLDFDDLEVDSTASKGLKSQAGKFTDLSFAYGISSDKRDRAFMPTNGTITNFSQSVPLYADKSFLRNTFSHSAYKSLTEDVVGAGKIYVSTIQSR